MVRLRQRPALPRPLQLQLQHLHAWGDRPWRGNGDDALPAWEPYAPGSGLDPSSCSSLLKTELLHGSHAHTPADEMWAVGAHPQPE